MSICLFVHFDLWSLIFEKNGPRLTLKSFFTPPTNKLFWYGKNKNILLQCNCTNFATIKRYCPFCFLWLYARQYRFSLQKICLYVCLFHSVYLSNLYVWLFCSSVFSVYVCSVCLSVISSCLSFLNVCLFCLSAVQKWKRIFCFTPMNWAWP